MRGDESFADDLNVEGGTVSSRVALLLRSAEVKPFLLKICSSSRGTPLPPPIVERSGLVGVGPVPVII